MEKKQKYQIILSVILFIVILATLGIPYTKWGFKTDDFGNIQHSFIKNYKDIFRFFYEGNIETVWLPSGTKTHPGNFFAGLYRPMSFIFYLPQVFFFGTHPYGYFLTTIVLHAINTVLLFHIFTMIAPLILALLAATYFAFHPSLHWIGWISAQTYHTELLIFLVLILCVKKYLDSKRLLFYILSCFLLLTTLFLKEAGVVFALWSIPAIYLYTKNIKQCFLLSMGYWIITIFYLIIRAIVMPITSNVSTFNCHANWSSFMERFNTRLMDFVSFASDIIGLNWIPSNNRLIKGTIIATIFLLLFSCFIKSKKKIPILFLLGSVLLFGWPALLIQYQPRYIYLSLPFFILAILICIKKKPNPLWTLAAFAFIGYNAFFLTQKLKMKEKAYHFATTSFKSLSQNKTVQHAIQNHWALCLFNLPNALQVGATQAVWLMTQNDSYNVYLYGSHKHKIKKAGYKKITENLKTTYNEKKIIGIEWDEKKSWIIR